jgi:hypothetical protein
MWRHRVEEELEQYEQDKKASLWWAVEPRNLTMDALWDEYFYHKSRRFGRVVPIRSEINQRNQVTLKNIDKWSAEQCEQYRQDHTNWCQKYETSDTFSEAEDWSETVLEALNNRLTDISRKEDLQGEEEP